MLQNRKIQKQKLRSTSKCMELHSLILFLYFFQMRQGKSERKKIFPKLCRIFYLNKKIKSK
jgi:hypothetical protein